MKIDLDPIFNRPLLSHGPGLAVGVYQHGRILYMRGYGRANVTTGEPVTTRTLFNIGSVSKQFTAYAVYLLQECGLLSVQDKLLRHFPEMPKLYKDITIQQIIQHRSGLRCVNSLTFLDAWMDPKHPPTRDWNRTLPLQKELNFPPGTDWSYCNSGYGLLAELVRRVTRRCFREFCSTEIFGPLGMRRSSVVDDHREIPQGSATGYFDSPRGIQAYAMSPACPGPTDVWSNAEEMALWDQHLGSRSKIHSQARRAMFASAPCARGNSSRYGGGLLFFNMDGRDMFGHGGYDLGFRADYRHDLKSGLSIVCLGNQEGVDPAALAAEAMRSLPGSRRLGPKKPKQKILKPIPSASVDIRWKRHLGDWLDERDGGLWSLSAVRGGLQVNIYGYKFDILEKGGKLRGQGEVGDSVFKFEELPGAPAALLQFKKSGLFKRLSFLGNPGSIVKNARDYQGFYRSPETGILRALKLQGSKLRVYYPWGPGSHLKFIRPDELLTEVGARLLFERDGKGRVQAMTVEAPGGRTRRLRLLKSRFKKRLFPLRGREWMDHRLEKRMVDFIVKAI